MVIQTVKGYGFYEVASAFQKGIRRSEEKVALYFAVELFNSGYDEFIWKRIKIIASEDVGLAEPNMPANIASLYASYSDLKKENKENKPERLFIVHAVIALCRAKKSRLIDLLMIASWRGHNDQQMEIPDYAFDKHTMKGKAMGRGVEHFHTEGAYCKNQSDQPGEPEARVEAMEIVKKHPGKLTFPPNSFSRQKNKELL